MEDERRCMKQKLAKKEEELRRTEFTVEDSTKEKERWKNESFKFERVREEKERSNMLLLLFLWRALSTWQSRSRALIENFGSWNFKLSLFGSLRRAIHMTWKGRSFYGKGRNNPSLPCQTSTRQVTSKWRKLWNTFLQSPQTSFSL